MVKKENPLHDASSLFPSLGLCIQ